MNRIAIELEGVFAGWLFSIEGGEVIGEVIAERSEFGPLPRKHISGIKYEDVTIECSFDIGKALYGWIKDTVDGKPSRKNGSIIIADVQYQEIFRLSFFNSLITEVRFPGLNAASKDAATIILTIKPEKTQLQLGTQKKVLFDVSSRQEKWVTSNFKLDIDGLPNASARVVKIEALVFKQATWESQESVQHHHEIPDLVITVPTSHAEEFYQWHADFVTNGNNGQEQEKNGSLEFLLPDMKKSLLTLNFAQLGIFKLTTGKVEAAGENIPRIKAEMYCEKMRLDYGK